MAIAAFGIQLQFAAPAPAEPATSCGAQLQTGGEWPVGSPQDAGLDTAVLCSLDDRLASSPDMNVHAVVVIRRGKLVYENYGKGEDFKWGASLGVVQHSPQTLHDVRSVSKSVVSLLLGIALDQNAIPGIDTAILGYFPNLRQHSAPEKEQIELRHLLTMTSGLAWDESAYYSPESSYLKMLRSTDPYRFAIGQPVRSLPGEQWNYSGGNTQLLAGVLQRSTGKWLADFARDTLFAPLGITEFEWMKMPANGEFEAASGLRLRPRDMAKIGELVLRNGMWKGRRIVSESWIRESTTGHIPNVDQVDSLRYGYHWWTDEENAGGQRVSWITAQGFGGQRIYIVPERDLVVVIAAGLYAGTGQDWIPYEIFSKYVLAATQE